MLTTATTTAKDTSDLRRQLALAEQELTMLRQTNDELETNRQKQSEENRRLQVLQRGNRSELKDKIDEMQRDVDRFVARINDLEKHKVRPLILLEICIL